MLPPEALRDAPVIKRGTAVRVMSPIGHYWLGTLREPDALYSGQVDLVFVAYHFDEASHEGDYYSEFDEPVLEEVRLLAALALAIGWDGGSVSLYPHGWSFKLPELLDLASPDVETALRQQILDASLQTQFQYATDPPPPPSHGGPAYQFRDAPMPLEFQRGLIQACDLTDHLLMRGLAAWLKGDMLRHHRMFGLEALYSTYVALDASFSMVCRELRNQGIKNPDAWDASAFLAEAEGREHDGYAYFEEFYADRIRAMHPESRYGIFPYPPVMVDDLLWLNIGLREVFRLLILGECIDPKNYPNIGTVPAANDT